MRETSNPAPIPLNITHAKESERSYKGSQKSKDPFNLNRNWKTAVQSFGLQDSPLAVELDFVQNQIDLLTSLENQCWSASGIEGEIDSYGILQWVKQKVLAGNEDDEGNMKQLDELRKLRGKKVRILRQLFPISRGACSKGHSGMGASKATDGNKWWCVVIGISKYRSAENVLPSARGDGQAIYDFLRTTLGVPQENIILLLDEQATRKNIISSLRTHLLNNDRMTKEDKRLIYFAGHGSSYEATDYFTTPVGRTGAIEAICPVDRGTKDKKGKIIHDISDREVNIFLQAVRRRWGPQTVLILDCCHSGGATRGMANPMLDSGMLLREMYVRALPPVVKALPGMFEAIEDKEERNIAMGENWIPDMTTHVLLAACEDYEQAIELTIGGGVFTKALLSVLKTTTSLGEYQWKDIPDKVGPLFVQTPIALGLVDMSLWFESKEQVSHEIPA